MMMIIINKKSKIMNKLFIIFFLSLLSYNASAFEAKDFYLKGSIGTSKLKRTKEIKQSLNFTAAQDSILSPSIGLGVGCNLSQGTRAEIGVHIHSPYFDMSTTNLDYINNDNGFRSIGNIFIKRKATVTSLMSHYYIPVFQRDNYDIFIGGGIGIARIKEKVNFITTSNVVQDIRMFTMPITTVSSSTKVANNFAYTFAIGSTIKLQENISLELVYNWRDFGKTKPISVNGEDTLIKNRYIGHDFTVGLRLAI